MEKWTQRTDLWTQGLGELGECEMYGGSNMETYVTICKIDSHWEFAILLREHKQGFCNNLEGQDGEGNRKEVEEGGGICTPVTDSCDIWQKTTKFCEAIIIQLK